MVPNPTGRRTSAEKHTESQGTPSCALYVDNDVLALSKLVATWLTFAIFRNEINAQQSETNASRDKWTYGLQAVCDRASISVDE